MELRMWKKDRWKKEVREGMVNVTKPEGVGLRCTLNWCGVDGTRTRDLLRDRRFRYRELAVPTQIWAHHWPASAIPQHHFVTTSTRGTACVWEEDTSPYRRRQQAGDISKES